MSDSLSPLTDAQSTTSLDDGVYVVRDGELTQVASDDDVSRTGLQDAFDAFGINGRVDRQHFNAGRAQVVLGHGWRRTRTGPLPRKTANAIARNLEDVDGVGVDTEGYFTDGGHGRVTE